MIYFNIDLLKEMNKIVYIYTWNEYVFARMWSSNCYQNIKTRREGKEYGYVLFQRGSLVLHWGKPGFGKNAIESL